MSLLKLFCKRFYTNLFTTPSHGRKFFIVSKFRQFYKFDISETDTHNPQEALDKAQDYAAKIYGTKKTLFLTNGSSSGVIASVLACTQKDDKVLIWNKAHKCHRNAVELAGCEPVFYELGIDEDFGITKSVEVEDLKEKIDEYQPKALIVTSPSYEGVVANLKAIKSLCETNKVYLIVDEAHGALYPFSDELPQSAVNIADFTVQSLHKTAGGLNPTALLHTNTDLDIEKALGKINTTSPSYPLLATIEANINFLNSKRGRNKISELVRNIKQLKASCGHVEFFDGDVTKIVAKISNKTGYELSEELFDKYLIEDEKANDKSVLFLTGIGTELKDLKKLAHALNKIAK